MALGLGALLCRVLTTVTTYMLPAYLNFKELMRQERASPQKTGGGASATASVMLFDRCDMTMKRLMMRREIKRWMDLVFFII